jgi:hypothetical protein
LFHGEFTVAVQIGWNSSRENPNRSPAASFRGSSSR